MDTKVKPSATGSTRTSSGREVLEDEDRLPPPEIEGVVDGKLDSADVPEGPDFTIPEWPDMVAGDKLEWFWLGQVEGGQASGELTIENVEDVTVQVSRAVIEINAASGDTVSALYAVTPEGGARMESDAAIINVLPLANDPVHPKPVVPLAQGDVLNPDDIPDKGYAEVIAEVYVGMEEGDTVWIYFGEGMGAGEHFEDISISTNLVGTDVPTYVPKAAVEFFDKATVEVYFKVVKKDLSEQFSEMLVLKVGESADRWPPPYVEEAEDGYLPEEAYQRGIRVVVPLHPDMENGDRVDYYWDAGDVHHKDGLTMSTPIENRFRMMKADVDPFLGKMVAIHYTITRGGVVVHRSEVYNLGVAYKPPGLPPPQMRQVVDGKLNVSDLTDGADVTVQPYADMAPLDTVSILWAGGFENGGATLQHYLSDGVVDKPIEDYFDIDDIERFIGQKVEVMYHVKSDLGVERDSESIEVEVVRAATTAQPPEIPAVVEGELDPRHVPDFAAVIVPYSAELMQFGDEIVLKWTCTNDDSDFTDDDVVGSGTSDFEFEVPYDIVKAGIDGTVTVSYDVVRLGNVVATGTATPFVVKQSPLPALTVKEAQGSNLDPDDVPAVGAKAEIGPEAMFALGDRVTLHWEGGTGYTAATEIKPEDVGKELLFMIPKDVVESTNDAVALVYYTVDRANGGETETSPNATYNVGRELAEGDLIVLGARNGDSDERVSGAPRYLRAVSATDRKDIFAEWRYEGELTSVSGSSFYDSKPGLMLHVRTEDASTTVRPLHIVGTGLDNAAVAGAAAFGAHLIGGGPYAWGLEAYGGVCPPTEMGTNIEQLHTTHYAMAGRRSNGGVIMWGPTANGGPVSPLPTDVVSLAGSSGAFAAIKKDGTLMAWGNANTGGTLNAEAAAVTDAESVVANSVAFCVRRKTGDLVTWGTPASGGEMTPPEIKLEKYTSVRGNALAFCATREDMNTVVAWGHESYGGKLSPEAAIARNIVAIASSTMYAFAVLTDERKVICWGSDAHGANPNDVIKGIDDFVEIVATNHAFCGRRENGLIVCWGNEAYGGKLVPDELALQEFVQITATAAAFAGLTREGKVFAWGDKTRGGDTTTVDAKLVDIRAVYSNSQAFTAIPAKGGAVCWGLAAGGGTPTQQQQTLLDQHVRYGGPGSAVSASSPQGRALAAYQKRKALQASEPVDVVVK